MSIDLLKKYAKLENIAEELDEEELQEIGSEALAGFDEDHQTCKEWIDDAKKVMKLASMKSSKKSYPLPDSANIKFPTITKIAYDFCSRTYPEIIRDGKVVKCRVLGIDYTGDKDKQAQRVSDYMNYQLMMESDEWEQQLDKSLTMLALTGFLCKKTYYDPVCEKIKSEVCDIEDLVINSKISCLADAPRISHVLHYKLNDLIEYSRAGLFCKEAVDELINKDEDCAVGKRIDVVEQHTFLDLDEDDYAEPYIVTFLKDSGKVLRIVARYSADSIKAKKDVIYKIYPDHYFTDYHFLPSPEGKFQGVGFGILMLHMNETINTILNQLTDAGSLANMQTGLISSEAKILDSGTNELTPGQFLRVKTDKPLKEAFEMVQYKEPSNVLYQLLSLLIDTTRDLSSSTEVMNGSSSPENVKSGAYMGMVEQGMKVHVAVLKRIYRSLGQEFKKIFHLNKLYLDPQVYINVLDDELAVQQKDFDEKSVDVMPVADPNLSSDVTRMAQAQFIGSLMQAPGVNPVEIVKYLVESSKIPNAKRFLLSDQEMQAQKQAPNPDTIKIQAEIEKNAQELNIKGRQLDLDEKRFQLEALKTQSEIILNRANAFKAVAQADQAQATTQLDTYDLQLRAIQTQLDHLLNVGDITVNHQQHMDEMNMRQQEMQQNANQPTADSGVSSTPPDQGAATGTESPPAE